MALEYSGIPSITLAALVAYKEKHAPVGDFLKAVLSNDLKNAVGYADTGNLCALKEIVMWVIWELPGVSQGSPEKYAEWIWKGNRHG